MKVNKIERKHPKRILAIAAVVFLAVVSTGVYVAYGKLREMWVRSTVVTDVAAQATCNDGAMVKSDTILDRFGIRNGVCLADIDFDAKRREILRDIPNIRAISVTRHMPNRVEVVVEERRPVVRMGLHGRIGATGRVADAEGVVFTCRRGTSMLPTIREAEMAVTPVGQRLKGRSLGALRLIEAASDARFSALGIQEADVTKRDFILTTLGNYALAKIAWSGMDAPTGANKAQLVKRLDHLLKAMDSKVGAHAKVWNATEENRIYADTRENLP